MVSQICVWNMVCGSYVLILQTSKPAVSHNLYSVTHAGCGCTACRGHACEIAYHSSPSVYQRLPAQGKTSPYPLMPSWAQLPCHASRLLHMPYCANHVYPWVFEKPELVPNAFKRG